MPELPEVETMCRGIAAIVGQTITDLQRCPCRRRSISITPALSKIRRTIQGRVIQAIERRGKRVLLCLDDGHRLVIEPRMTGLVLLAEPPTEAHLRFRIDFQTHEIGPLFFWDQRGLGTLRLLDAAATETVLGPDRLGPDALQITAQQLQARIGKTKRPLKVALLDQRHVAGIGNLYAAEILFTAKIDPRRAASSLSLLEWSALHRAIGKVLREAIRFEGSTLHDGTYRNALNQMGSYQNHHQVYGREGEQCSRCKLGTITRIVQAQRSTFFCERCQH